MKDYEVYVKREYFVSVRAESENDAKIAADIAVDTDPDLHFNNVSEFTVYEYEIEND